MQAEIIAVGTELLLGDILNTNAQYLSRKLAELGITVYHQSVTGDNSLRLKEELSLCFNRSEMVITTGGLGPTNDDLTKEVCMKYFNKTMVPHKESLEKIEHYFKVQGKPLTENNKKQAFFPEDAIILPNDHGTAPGCIINDNNKILILLPGPPNENVPMFENYVIPYLKKLSNNILVSRVLKICGLGESFVATKINDLINSQDNPTIAPYAKEGEVTLRITAKSSSVEKAYELISPVENKIRDLLGNNIYGIDDDTLESVIGEFLIKNNLTISTAESCTGGLLCGRLINYPGISNVLLEGVVTYSNKAKMDRINVKEDTLKKFGAVSLETALEMAEGVAKSSGSLIGISTTGLAGPGGGTDEKPVGLVYIGLYIQGKKYFKKIQLLGDRQSIRNRTVTIALNFLREKLLQNQK